MALLLNLPNAVADEEDELFSPAYDISEYEKIVSRSTFYRMFVYIFGMDYPYHNIRPRIEEEVEEVVEELPADTDEPDDIDYLNMSDAEFKKILDDVIYNYHPSHGTEYNAEWGHTCLTEDGNIPTTNEAIHFDVFDGYLPRGLIFHDLRVLFLYLVSDGYYLYKIKFGDMVVTLRHDLEEVSVHLFENFGNLMIVRIMFYVDGLLEKHEYIETAKRSKTFQKMTGRSITPPLPKFPSGTQITEKAVSDWMINRYKELSKRKPPIAEEIIKYNIVISE